MAPESLEYGESDNSGLEITGGKKMIMDEILFLQNADVCSFFFF